MLLSAVITPYVPYLRRFARSLTGSQSAGDACVVATLEAILANRAAFEPGSEPKVALYRLFLRIVSGNFSSATRDRPAGDEDLPHFRKISAIPERPRLAFLLSAMEDFTLEEVAKTLECSQPQARELIDIAGREIAAQLRANVLIIEDETIVALDLQKLLQQMGHQVVTVARTREEAVRAAAELRPGLILSDILLADGSSGLDAINEILPVLEAPVIFVTAFPEQLLTGQAPEPAFLITKPFTHDSVKAVVSQALFFDRKCHASKAGASSPPAILQDQPLFERESGNHAENC